MSSAGTDAKVFAFNLLVVSGSSIVAKTIAAPIERIKLILQNQESSLQVLQKERKRYKGIIDCLIRIPKEQGFLSFWRGNFTNVLRYIPTQALNFAFNDLIMSMLEEHVDSSNTIKIQTLKFLAGGLAGGVVISVLFPLDFCQTKLSVDVGVSATSRFARREYFGLGDCFMKVYKKEGITGLFHGYQVSLIGLSLYRAFYFGLFDGFKVLWLKDYRLDAQITKLPLVISLIVAQIVTCTAAVLTYPMDTVSRRLMLDSGRPKEFRLFTGAIDATRQIYAREGLIAFYRGSCANCLRSLSGSLVLVFYDEVLYYTQWKRWISPCGTCN